MLTKQKQNGSRGELLGLFFISTHTWVPRFLKIKKNIVGKAIKKVKQKREKE
ncbi:MAG: hypothetical protein IJW96_03180 [Clostridia bacterium]|nr:hypothetical protein [Clostridia bacterium]